MKYLAVAFIIAFWTGCAAAQPAKLYRIAFIAAASGPSPFYEALRQGLADLGYVEGRNIVVEYRSSEDRDKLPALANEVVQLKVDAIITQGPTARSIGLATGSIPVVFGFSGDPVEAGFVASLARPGRNMTGMTFLALELAGKRLELLKELSPKLSRVAVLANRSHPGEQNEFKETQAAAQAMKTSLQYLSLTTGADFDKAFDAMRKERPGGMLTFPDAFTLSHVEQLSDFAVKARMPSMFGWKEYVEDGGLVSYGPNLNDCFRRLAQYVDKILKGAKPADLPVEQPTKFELVINLKTAQRIGLTIPPNVLARADRVIK
ncbi:MAG TPA: ABC transporter substrate-binding protein [Candidatus Binatia bacterium]